MAQGEWGRSCGVKRAFIKAWAAGGVAEQPPSTGVRILMGPIDGLHSLARMA